MLSELPANSRSECPPGAAGQRTAHSVLGDKGTLGPYVAWVPPNLPVLLEVTSHHILLAGGFFGHRRAVAIFFGRFYMPAAHFPAPPRGVACADQRELGKQSQGPLGLFCSCSWSHIKPIA